MQWSQVIPFYSSCTHSGLKNSVCDEFKIHQSKFNKVYKYQYITQARIYQYKLKGLR